MLAELSSQTSLKYQSAIWELCLTEVKNWIIIRVWMSRQVGGWVEQGVLNAAMCPQIHLFQEGVEHVKVQVVREASEELAESQ